MSSVVLQPCGKGSMKNYEETIESPKDIAVIAPLLPKADVDRLKELYPSGKVPLWGTRPGEGNRHVGKWSRVRPGDVILFSGNNKVFTLGVITHLFQNEALAKKLWGTTLTANEFEQTWEYMFAVDDLRTVSIPYGDLNRVAGRKANAVVQDFTVLDQSSSDSVLAFLDMVGNEHTPVQSENDYQAAVKDPNFEQMETRVEAIRRAEQAFLRKRLFPGETAYCAICNREFPVRFLVAAHIKRRSACTDDEKRDYDNVVMPNCTFGCDALFGRGLISVDDEGKFHVSPMLEYGQAAGQHLQDFVRDRACDFWAQNVDARPYFKFHWETDYKNAVLEPEAVSI